MGIFKRRKKFGEILVEKGLATKKDIEDALRIQKELQETKNLQKKIGDILSEKGVIGVEDINSTLREQERMSGFLLKGLVYSIFHSKQPR